MRRDLGRFLRRLANKLDPPPMKTIIWSQPRTSTTSTTFGTWTTSGD